MSEAVDLAIVGAGPAGLAAAATAAELGLGTVVVDDQGEPGGQIYRAVEAASATRPRLMDVLGPDYARGVELARAFRASGARYLPRRTVWQIDDERRVFMGGTAGMEVVAAKRVLIAAGAMERPMPVPGWTLPGVVTCGGAQTVLKANALVPQGKVVVVGLGPLLLLITHQLVQAGVRVGAVLETAPYANLMASLPHLPAALTAPGYVAKGLGLMRAIRAAGVPIRRRVADVRILGEGRATEVAYRWRGRLRREPADLVLVHQGVVPNANLGLSLRLAHRWDEAQRCFRPVVDAWGQTSAEGVLAAGDCAGIGGAVVAEFDGRLAALAAAQQLGRIGADERDNRARPLGRERDRHLRIRPFLDALYRPRDAAVAPVDPSTLVCRCEEVTAGEIRSLVTEQGCPGPNQMKSFSRSGMGPCQGRLCGLTVSELIAEARGVPVGEVGYYRIRPPIKPVTVGDLASLEEADFT